MASMGSAGVYRTCPVTIRERHEGYVDYGEFVASDGSESQSVVDGALEIHQDLTSYPDMFFGWSTHDFAELCCVELEFWSHEVTI